MYLKGLTHSLMARVALASNSELILHIQDQDRKLMSQAVIKIHELITHTNSCSLTHIIG